MRAAPLGVREGDREQLERRVRSSTVAAGSAQRARIVLLAADGHSNVEIAGRVGVSLPTVTSWRARYRESGIGGADEPPPPGGARGRAPPPAGGAAPQAPPP